MSTDAPPPGTLEPGELVAGFRIEQLIGPGSAAVVYEATQVSLDRRVALKLIPPDPALAERFRRLSWPDHAHVVATYAAGTCEHGQFVAMHLVRGATLAEVRDTGRLDPLAAGLLLGEVAAALDAAHRAGIVHGAVTANNVLIDRDGRVRVSDFGLGPADATAASDRAAFASLVRECVGDEVSPLVDGCSSAADIVREGIPEIAMPAAAPPPRRRRAIAAVSACALAAAAAAVFLLAGGDESASPAPPAQKGALVLGSALPGSGVSSLDCEGRRATGASQACTLVQTTLAGRPVVARRDGAIRRWTVRGARGDLALRVLRRRGDRFVWVARTPYQLLPDESPHVLPANLSVHKGDIVGLDVTPGASIGVRKDVKGASTARWFGVRNPAQRPSFPVQRGAGTGFDHELLLRVEYVAGARPHFPGRLTGSDAATAPAGRREGEQDVELRDGSVRSVAIVSIGDEVAIDMFSGDRRIVRLPVPGLDPDGHVFDLQWFGAPLIRLEWLNPDGLTVSHEYAIGARSVAPIS